MARHTDLIPPVQERIVNALRVGNTDRTASVCGGVAPQTFYAWLRRGDAGEEPFASFRSAVDEARAEAEQRAVAVVQRAANGWVEEMVEEGENKDGPYSKTRKTGKFDWGAASWFLERRNPEDWGNRSKVELAGSVGLTKVGWAVEGSP